jgi:2,4-dienoyl-CoA reductase-like NADH-dependent reductase (Old Yellow Enzyme family)
MSTLFSPFKLREMNLPNRIVVSPMLQHAAKDGCATDWHLMHYGNFSVSGAGLVITEATATEPRGRCGVQCLGLYSDETEAAFSRVVKFVRDYSEVKFGVQLAHSGRKGSITPTWVPRRTLKPEEGGWRTVSCSPIEESVFQIPHELSAGEIDELIETFVDSVKRCDRLGIDMIELHFAHGYLFNQFLSPLTNLRKDRYGGDRNGRMRMPLEAFERCRGVWPQEKAMGVRISTVDWVEGGWAVEDSVVFARELKKLGCDYICASSGGVSARQKITAGKNYQVPFAEMIRREVGLATIAVGQITEAHQAEDIVAGGKADLVAIGRRMLYNPRWAWHAAYELGEQMAYPPRYRTCHPRMGAVLTLPESKEHTLALMAVNEANEAAQRRDRGLS